MCDVLWCHTNAEGAAVVWAALIGLLGGILALAGALVIGRRQIDIQGRQTLIANRIAELEEMKLRSELYDRRVAILSVVREFAESAYRHQKMPGLSMGADGELHEKDLFVRFSEAMSAAEFLLSRDTVQYINSVRDMALEFRRIEHLITIRKLKDPADDPEYSAQRGEVRLALQDKILGLQAAFAKDLRLVVDPAASEPGHIDDQPH